jgi:hypothetical protein
MSLRQPSLYNPCQLQAGTSRADDSASLAKERSVESRSRLGKDGVSTGQYAMCVPKVTGV